MYTSLVWGALTLRVAYVSTYSADDPTAWSGSGFSIAECLKKQGVEISFVGPLKRPAPCLLFAGARKLYYRQLGRRHLIDRERCIVSAYAGQISRRLKDTAPDVIFSPGTVPLGGLTHSQPIVFWTDATFAGLVDFYPDFTNLSKASLHWGNHWEQRALAQCRLAIYSSDWAAKTAIENYNVDASKIHVVPFGANIGGMRFKLDDITRYMELRSRTQIDLLFVGVDWQRKGGDIALAIAEALNARGVPTKLTVVGAPPPVDSPLVDYVGFLSKSKLDDLDRLVSIYGRSHFLVLPSRAECAAVVLAEALSLGVPCLASDVGGIKTIVVDNVSGMTFSLSDPITPTCDFVEQHIHNWDRYRDLAYSSFAEYEARLNWDVAGAAVVRLLQNHCLGAPTAA